MPTINHSTKDAPSSCLPPPKPDLGFTRPPKTKWLIFLWRWRIWVEATFVLSMLEPWEKFLLVTLFLLLNSLMLTGIIKYLPLHVSIMQRRAMYYLWGTESSGSSAAGGLLKELL